MSKTESNSGHKADRPINNTNMSGWRFLNPLRWLYLIIYLIGPFFYDMAKANIDVAVRVVTGNIKPGIVKIRSDLNSSAAVTLLANSITLTPGTLTVDIDEETNELYIHWIYVSNKEPKTEDICNKMHVWARRIAE